MGPSKVAHVLAKVIAGGAAFGGAAWLLRSFLHSLDIDNVENIKSSARASRKLETTKLRPTAPAVNYKVPKAPKKEEPKPEEMKKEESYEMMIGAAPALAALVSILATTKLADKYYDNKLGQTLDKELGAAKAQSQDLALDRILRNRGLQEQKPEGVADAYNQELTSKAKQRKQQKQVKKASVEKEAAGNGKYLPQGLESALGLTLFTMLALGGVVGYKWQQANSPALAKYKAYKKGLETYNKERALSENIESTPLNPEFLDYLDTNLASAKKQAPAAPAETSLKELMI